MSTFEKLLKFESSLYIIEQDIINKKGATEEQVERFVLQLQTLLVLLAQNGKTNFKIMDIKSPDDLSGFQKKIFDECKKRGVPVEIITNQVAPPYNGDDDAKLGGYYMIAKW